MRKTYQKIAAFVAPYIDLSKSKILMNNSRTWNNELNRLHERCLRLIYNYKRSTFK